MAHDRAVDNTELTRMLKHAASAAPVAMPASLGDSIMARVRVDDGRVKRMRSLVRSMLLLATIAGLLTAAVIGWKLASKDKTHTMPPKMKLFREGMPK